MIKCGDLAPYSKTMAEQDAEPIEVPVRQVGENTRIDPALGKTLRVLPEPELVEPFPNRLHWSHRLCCSRLAPTRSELYREISRMTRLVCCDCLQFLPNCAQYT